MKKIYLLTNFSSYLASYSPIIICASQLQMLTDNGYKPVLIACQGWEPPKSTIFASVETKRLKKVPVANTPTVDATFDDDVDTLYDGLSAILEDDSIVITHDLIFLPDYVKHHLAARKVAEEKPGIRWIHWIHSATNPLSLIKEREMYGDTYKDLLSQAFPNSVIAYPNSYDIPRVARNFGYEEDQVFEVPHSTDPTEGMEELVKQYYKESRLWEADMFMVYPLRLDRGKNAEMNVHLAAACKRKGLIVRLLFCDFQSTGDDKVVYRKDLKSLAKKQAVEDEVIFLSDLDTSAHLEVPHKTILDFLTLSNVFLMPSRSETYSLVVQEAMLKGNFCILNHDFTPLRQIYGDNAIYKQFSSNIGMNGYDGEINTQYHPSIEAYFDDVALAVKYYLEHDKVIKAKTWVRKERSPEAVFSKWLEPLLSV